MITIKRPKQHAYLGSVTAVEIVFFSKRCIDIVKSRGYHHHQSSTRFNVPKRIYTT